MIGAYGPWAAAIAGDGPRAVLVPQSEVRRDRPRRLAPAGRGAPGELAHARKRRRPQGRAGSTGSTTTACGSSTCGWSLPYGPPTEAYFLKPAGANGRLPGILAFHDHGGNKYFGARKITRISDDLHPMMRRHQEHYYGGLAWANELARRGYGVLVHDAFPFASRRVRAADLARGAPQEARNPQGRSSPSPSRRSRLIMPSPPSTSTSSRRACFARGRPGPASSRPKISGRSTTWPRVRTSTPIASVAAASPGADCARSSSAVSTTASAAPAVLE